jgi:hypothetical protein
MGFFQDTKPPEQEPRVIVQKQDWLTVLFAGLFSILGLMLAGLGKAYWHVMKPLLTFENKTRSQVLRQLFIAAALNGIPMYLLYLVPWVRDFTTLSATHTINHTNGYRIMFPDRSYFVPQASRQGGNFDSKTYITYAGYTEGTFQKMESGTCQMVPRGMKIRLGSSSPPTNAEGFKDEVKYIALQKTSSLSGFSYAWQWVTHPKMWFRKKELDELVVEEEKEVSWKNFIDDWYAIRADNGPYKSFEVEALAREHAVVCF